MAENADDYDIRKRAGEETGDMLAEEARLNELGLGFPLNMMHTLYYESSGDNPEYVRPRIAELGAGIPPMVEPTIRIYEQKN